MRICRVDKENISNILENLLKRSPNQYGSYQSAVDEIVADVRENGDAALFAYAKKFDKADLTADNLCVTEEEIKEAYDAVDPSLGKLSAGQAPISALTMKDRNAIAGLKASQTGLFWDRK